MRKIILFLLSLVIPLQAYAEASKFYTVNHGDNLSNILFRYGIRPLYGRNGSIAETIQLNPALKVSRGNYIRPGLVLILPSSVVESVSEKPFRKESSQGESTADRAPEVKKNFPQEKVETAEASLQKSPSFSLKDYPRSSLSVRSRFKYSRFVVEDKNYLTELDVLSNLDHGLNIGYNVDWSEDLSIGLNVGYQDYSLKRLNRGFQFSADSGKLYNLQLEVSRKVLRDWKILIGLGVVDEIFFWQTQSLLYEVSTPGIVQAKMGADYLVLSKGRFRWNTSAEYMYLLSSKLNDSSIDAGQRWGLYSSLSETFRFWSEACLKLKLGFENGTQNSSFSNKRDQNIHLDLQLNWEI